MKHLKPTRTATLLMLLSALMLNISPLQAQVPDSMTLFDFNGGFDLNTVTTQCAEVLLVGDADNQQLQIKTEHQPEPEITIHNPEGSWDLNTYHHVKMDITNAGDQQVQVVFRVGDPEDGMEAWQMEINFDLEPGESKTVADDITTTPWVFSRPLEILGLRAAPGQPKTDLSKINQVTIAVKDPEAAHTLIIDNIRATNPVRYVDPEGFFPFVDKFGQYKHADWPGKTLSEDDLRQQRDEEAAALKANPGPESFNKYGGWKDGPKLEATGSFRTQKHAGVWWLVDPDGCLFWSHGACCVNAGSATTGITDREAYYEELPDRDGSFGQFYGENRWGAAHGYYKEKGAHDTYNFTAANLYRKFGPEWHAAFNRTAHARLRSWGMNTLAISSSGDLCHEQKTPYVKAVWVRGTRKIEASDGYWGPFHDVFDPGFREAFRRSIERRKEFADDPWCIGFFVENELSWGLDGSLALAALASPSNQPAKQVFIEDLKAKYSDVEKLNVVWGTAHESWDALLQSEEEPDEEKARTDLMTFYQKITETYFSIVKEEMNAAAPNMMYLGCRLAWSNSDIVAHTAAKYCDVLSYNKYEYSVEEFRLPDGIDKPILISEFHFGALDRGALHIGIRGAFSQAHRGELYTDYVQGALRNPNIVGTHWFQYGEQSVTGRSDGENYNVGLIDVCDTPFRELTDSVRAVGHSLYPYRLNAAQK